MGWSGPEAPMPEMILVLRLSSGFSAARAIRMTSWSTSQPSASTGLEAAHRPPDPAGARRISTSPAAPESPRWRSRRFPNGRIVGVELREVPGARAREGTPAQREERGARALARRGFPLERAFRLHLVLVPCQVCGPAASRAQLPRNAEGRWSASHARLHVAAEPRPAHPLAPLLQGAANDRRSAAGWREIYHGLPQLIEETRWLPELQHALAENGFADVRAPVPYGVRLRDRLCAPMRA